MPVHHVRMYLKAQTDTFSEVDYLSINVPLPPAVYHNDILAQTEEELKLSKPVVGFGLSL